MSNLIPSSHSVLLVFCYSVLLCGLLGGTRQIQYPDALAVMTGDLGNLRGAAYFLSKTEIKFDLVSAVDELNKQIKLEFDFVR